MTAITDEFPKYTKDRTMLMTVLVMCLASGLAIPQVTQVTIRRFNVPNYSGRKEVVISKTGIVLLYFIGVLIDVRHEI